MTHGTSGLAAHEKVVSFHPLMRQILYGVIFGMPLLAGFGNWWCAQPGGAGTQMVLGVARAICPEPGAARKHASVGHAAHALDWAVLRRLGDLLVDGQRCRARTNDTGRHVIAIGEMTGQRARHRRRP